MASKADKNAANLRSPGTTAKGSEPAAATHTTPNETSVLLVQVEALEEDDAIRLELKRQGFHIKHQALVHLTKEDASHFVLQVCDPASALHAGRAYVSAEATASSSPRIDTEVADIGGSSVSPRDKGPTSPRSPAAAGSAGNGSGNDVSSGRLSGENVHDAIHALSSGPALMLAVEKPNAVTDLLELVGPANPELWNSTAPNCLRARFGKSSEALGVRCSLQESTVALEIEFLLACSGPSRESRYGVHSTSSNSKTAKSKKSAVVDLEQLLDFLFPPHLQHPNSAGRLFVFGLYGPLDAKARLRSGEKGLHIVTDLELTAMSKRMEREDILSVYKMCSLSQMEEEEVLMQVDQMMKSFPQYTPRDIRALFQSLPAKGGSGGAGDSDPRVLSFHEMQIAIMKERCRRVLCMKEKLHPALAPPIQNQYRLTLKRLMKTTHEIAPASLFLKDTGFTGAENATLVSRLLSNHSFEICHLDDGNSPSLTQNVRLLREQIRPVSETREPWNSSCQHQHQEHRK